MKDNTESSRQMKKITGTDAVPYKFLTRLDNRMPLRYRKLWFQLTCPQGRIRIIVHSHTKDAASCTAQVYLNKKDSRPVSSCTAACSREEAADFLKTAKNRALTGALIQAGFTRPEKRMPAHTRKDSPTPGPVSPAVNQPVGRRPQPLPEREETHQAKSIDEEKASPARPGQPVPEEKTLPDTDSLQAAGTAEPIPFPGSEKEPAASADAQPSGEGPEQKNLRETDSRQTADPVPDRAGRAVGLEDLISPAAAAKLEDPQSHAAQLPYTSSTPVEEIKKHMSLEDALHTRVDKGVCKGMTLEEISVKRFPNLRWYIYGYRGDDNILRAAAQLVWDSLQERNKAG